MQSTPLSCLDGPPSKWEEYDVVTRTLNLFKRGLSDSDKCDICNVPETISHFFIKCTAYDRLRSDIVRSLPLETLNIHTILHVSPRYDDELNIVIQKTMQQFLSDLVDLSIE